MQYLQNIHTHTYYCDGKDAVYGQYIYGQVCLAVYRQGDENGAVDKAITYLDGSFSMNNALVTILVTAVLENDDSTVEYIKGKMLALQSEIEAQDKAYFEETLRFAQSSK